MTVPQLYTVVALAAYAMANPAKVQWIAQYLGIVDTVLGAVAGGVYPDIQTAAENMTSVDYVIKPDPEKHKQYQFYYEKYKEFYHLAKDWMHAVTMHATDTAEK